MPGLDLSVMRDPSLRPAGYHDEFLATMAAAGPQSAEDKALSAAVDAQLYKDDPTFVVRPPRPPNPEPPEEADEPAPPKK